MISISKWKCARPAPISTRPRCRRCANHWYILLEDQAKQWRLQGEWKPAEGQTVSLGHPNLEPAD